MSRTAPHRMAAIHDEECDGATVLVAAYDDGEEPLATYRLSLRAARCLYASLGDSIQALASTLDPDSELEEPAPRIDPQTGFAH